MQGTLLKSTGSWYTVRLDSGELMECRIRGKFRTKGIKNTNPVAVGDRVEIEQEENEVTGLIVGIEERKNYIIRKSVNLSKQTHIIAANIDQALLMITVAHPKTFTGFIDRFLVTAEAYSIPVVLLFNKIDIYTDEELGELALLLDTYERIGYQCIDISVNKGYHIDEVKALMKDKVTLISGNSGVGKSSLINKIDNQLDLKTNKVSESNRSGQHTTTFAEMHELQMGGFIIDTPGIKGFGLVDMEPEEIGDYFPEIFELKSECKFHNCMHVDEPQCAVKTAVEEGEIAWSRSESYMKFLEGDDEASFRKDIYAE